MELTDSYAKKYKCDYCSNEISVLTLKLQNDPSSDKWRKHGLCSASCSGHYHTPEAYSVQPGEAGIPAEEITSDFDSSAFANEEFHNMSRRIESSKRLIISGKYIAAAGVLTSFILFYSDHEIWAISGLTIVLIGIFLCRLGVWKKCRVK